MIGRKAVQYYRLLQRALKINYDLGDDDCIFRLQEEIRRCPLGGRSEVAGWRFM